MDRSDDKKKKEIDLMRQVIELSEENQILKDKLLRLESLMDDELSTAAEKIVDAEKELSSVENSITVKQHELNYVVSQVEDMHSAILRKNNQLDFLEDEIAYQDMGLYRPKYPCTGSPEYLVKIEETRKEQKHMIDSYSTFEYGFLYDEDFTERQLQNLDIMDMATIAFNCECELLISKVDTKNVKTIEDKMRISIDRMNFLLQRFDISLSERYTDLKIKELYLCHEYLMMQKKEESMRFGFLYILSNGDSLGENVYSIGSTRRLDPVEHISALNDEISPYMFDIHAILPSDDVDSLRDAVCGPFEKYRVASTGRMGDLFNVTLSDIERQLQLNYDSSFTFDRIYRATGRRRVEENKTRN